MLIGIVFSTLYQGNNMKQIKRIPFESKILGILLLVILIVLLAAFFVRSNLKTIVDEITEEARPDESLVLMKGIQYNLMQAEAKAKTYSLNRAPSNLEDFNKSIESVKVKLEQLRKLSQKKPQRIESLVQLDSLINLKFEVLEDFLVLQSNYRTSEVLEKVLEEVEKVDDEEETSVSENSQDSEQSFFKKIFNKRKDKTAEEDEPESTSNNSNNLDYELKKLKEEEQKRDEELKREELALLEHDQEITSKITTIIQTLEKEENIKLAEKIENANEQKNTTNLWVTIYGLITALFLILAGWAVYSYVKTNNRIKRELEQSKNETEEKNNEITSSINYAKRIQTAILPDLAYYNQFIPNSFIYYEPKDIVAGDFYWAVKTEEKLLIAVADCTGHGVPGAMVSVVCHNALNKSVREMKLTDPAEILDATREIVIDTLDNRDGLVYDGMDISLCVIDFKSSEIIFSGANNSLYVVPKSTGEQFINRNNFKGEKAVRLHGSDGVELVEVRADKQPVARYFNPRPFSSHRIKFEKGDTIYMFTDGYADQFGGEKRKKLTYKRFRDILVANANKPMEQQRKELEKELYRYKGNIEQIDDICVMGINL